MRITHRYLFIIIIVIASILISILVLFVRQAYVTEQKEFDISSGSIVSSIFYEESRKVNDSFHKIEDHFFDVDNIMQPELNYDKLRDIVLDLMTDYSNIDSLVKDRMINEGIYTDYKYQFSVTKLRIMSDNRDIIVVGDNSDIPELKLYGVGGDMNHYNFKNSFYYYQGDNYMEITLRSLFPVKSKSLFLAMLDKIIISVILFCAIIVMVILIIKNIIKQKHLLDMKSDFIDNITHEFNTPLSTINLASDILQHNDIGSDSVKMNAEIIKRQIIRLRKMIDNAVDLSLFLNKQQILNCESISIHALIDRCTEEYKSDNKNVRFIKRYCQDNDIAFVDGFYLHSALGNLIDNTIKYSDNTDVCINISTSRGRDEFLINYRDNGPGINKDDQKHIFNKFYRGKNRSNKNGLGLGLYIVKRTLNAHKGSVVLDKNYTDGAGFILKIPVSK